MSGWLRELGRRLRPFRADSDIRDELQAHFEELTEEGLSAGLSMREPDGARVSS